MIESEINRDILDKIYMVSERIVIFDGLDDILDHIVRTAVLLTKAEAVTIRLFDMKEGDLKIVKGFGVSNGFLSQPPIRIGEGVTGKVVLDGKPFMTDDITKSDCCVHKELARLEKIRAVMSVPMKTKESTIGCITVYKKNKPSFTEHDLMLLSIFAAQATEAVEKTHLLGELKKQAMLDPLTEIYNKSSMMKEIESKIKLSGRHSYQTSVIFIDIDNFKDFNDIHGHLLGDKLLCDFASIMKESCRKTDSVGRFGGEEFLILAPHTGKKGVLKTAEKLREIVAKHKFTGKFGDVLITFSAGISSFPDDGQSAEEVLRKADELMYKSKKAGKNRISVS